MIIPTYNERENIEDLLNELLREFENIKDDMSVLVVDDSSPDGTAEVVEKFTEKYPGKVSLLKREDKKGLGSAYIAGLKHAMNDLETDVIFEMDADFSHDPRDITRFLKEINSGSDLVIGSRYIKGGDIPAWSFKRRLISRGGNFFAKVVAGIPVHDCTSGFRAIRTSLLKKIDLDSLDVQGYAFQMSLLHKAMKNGASIKEISIVFHDRKYGESKLGNVDLLEFFVISFKLRFGKK